MAECQSRSMECLPGSGALDQLGRPPLDTGDPSAPAPAVHRISHYGMTYVLQMHSNLMGAAGVELQPKQLDHVEARNHGCIGAGGSASRHDRHPLAVLGVPGQRRLDLERAG